MLRQPMPFRGQLHTRSSQDAQWRAGDYLP